MRILNRSLPLFEHCHFLLESFLLANIREELEGGVDAHELTKPEALMLYEKFEKGTLARYYLLHPLQFPDMEERILEIAEEVNVQW